jgi:hypothetical protein
MEIKMKKNIFLTIMLLTASGLNAATPMPSGHTTHQLRSLLQNPKFQNAIGRTMAQQAKNAGLQSKADSFANLISTTLQNSETMRKLQSSPQIQSAQNVREAVYASNHNGHPVSPLPSYVGYDKFTAGEKALIKLIVIATKPINKKIQPFFASVAIANAKQTKSINAINNNSKFSPSQKEDKRNVIFNSSSNKKINKMYEKAHKNAAYLFKKQNAKMEQMINNAYQDYAKYNKAQKQSFSLSNQVEEALFGVAPVAPIYGTTPAEKQAFAAYQKAQNIYNQKNQKIMSDFVKGVMRNISISKQVRSYN